MSFHSHRNPSTPIEIPKRGRPFVPPLVSPFDEPKSPDLIFEMSPISPISPPFNRTIPLSTSNNNAPFVYNVPPPCRINAGTHLICSRQRVMPSSTAAPISAAERNAWRTQTTHAAEPEGVNDDHDDHDGTPQSERNGLPRTQSTTKITGFIPIVEHQSPMTDRPSKPIVRLSPPPRRASHSSSPWIILSSNDNVDDDIAYSQMDPSLFEFKQHLLQRIENRDAGRFMSFHSCLQ